MELNARIRREEGMYWAEVVELPGCFASGETLDELKDALTEAVLLYLQDDESASQPSSAAAKHSSAEVDEMKLCLA